MFAGLDHVELVVEDPQRMADFLVPLGFTIMGRKPDQQGGHKGTIKVRFPGEGDQPYMDLRSNRDFSGKVVRELGYRHIGLRCENFGETFQTLEGLGIPFTREPHVGGTDRMVVTMIDPQGGHLQCVEHKPDWQWQPPIKA